MTPSSSTQALALDPCPFCGEVLEIRSGRNPYGRHSKDSECIMAGRAVNIPIDVERWNRRAALPTEAPEPVALVREQIARVKEMYEVGDPLRASVIINLEEVIGALKAARPATVSSAVPRSWEIVTKPGNVPDYTCFPTVAEQARRDGRLVTPLYAEQVSSAVPKVKVLEWGAWDAEFDVKQARTIIGAYLVTLSLDDISGETWAAFRNGTEQIGVYASEDAATTAAQADYEQRIRSALEPLQSPQQLDRDAIIEAAKALIYSRTDTYRGGNNRQVGIQDQSGEKMWIVPFDEMAELERAINA